MQRRPPGQPLQNPVDVIALGTSSLWRSCLPLPDSWQGRSWDDPTVAQAYLNYVQRLASAIKPDFLCYAFEVNSNWVNQPPARFAAFLRFLTVVRDGLRQAFPETPLLIEVVLGDDAYMEDRWRHTEALVPFADILSISTYPYLFDSVAANNATVPSDWFRRLKDRTGSTPLAVQETGFLGADFHHPDGRQIPGRGNRPIMVLGEEASQARYVAFLLKEANALDFRFVNWWVWRDLDRLWERIKTQEQFADPMAAQWNHTGLQDMDARRPPEHTAGAHKAGTASVSWCAHHTWRGSRLPCA